MGINKNYLEFFKYKSSYRGLYYNRYSINTYLNDFIFPIPPINEQEKIEEPDFLKYNEDKYKGRVKFRWQYEKDYNGKYTLCNFIPICECGCQLDEKWQIGNRHFGTEQYVCPKCGKQYGNVLDYDEMQSFNKILISNIQNGEYKDVNRK